MKTYSRIMGIPVPKLTMKETIAIIDQVIDEHRSELFHVVTLNPEITMSCQHDTQLRNIVEEAGLLTADGMGIVMVSRLKGNPLPERVTGCDLLLQLLQASGPIARTYYLLGASKETNQLAAEEIERSYPGAKVIGRQHGFYGEHEEGRIIAEIGRLRPDILVVALGAPRSEQLIHRYKSVLNARIAMGVGGSLDIIAGTVKRAPAIWQKWNVEWLYRLLNQPSRWRRQLILPRFAIRALMYKDKN
ncbi:WecB/TagA/CpsF family glycosyltransferase [Paenibacillus sp. CF384]|uniref:WecB/TagA/CpsF family glycosyltransferase n=1 Tax=Paenibacillus sp. CF384 TaxID=1884382 RepID=UPI00089B42F5|nr:WecB/TagA/CpsF family glycosyltransferase [Paenibacillus sp. CF384]SDW19776.1 N-acetylglucosaminyldiphosphoundecaprenol N-acetyl-beta-D-mannosaminyltransferase [Paenibacillus sp. CF384]